LYAAKYSEYKQGSGALPRLCFAFGLGSAMAEELKTFLEKVDEDRDEQCVLSMFTICTVQWLALVFVSAGMWMKPLHCSM
jgi:hypothetical protein